ncbi:cytochrome P450 [Aspergillus pseudoustus]|uniref:Cytochrome P450 n=1 Tax=Aspergillus pseudoustus TaxID=1810923 RepID=A0ABR4J0U0_9EURO
MSIPILPAIALSSLLYASVLVIYRLWFSPIASFPGPLLAKCTFLYEFYYDWVRCGQFYIKIEELHKEYGPIIRITPSELHVREPLFYHDLYVTRAVRKSDAYRGFTQGAGFDDITAVSIPHDTHRAVRAALSPLFSPSGLRRVEHRVLACVRKLATRLEERVDMGVPVNLSDAFASFSTDVTSALFHEEPGTFLDEPTFNAAWWKMLTMGVVSVPLIMQLPWVARLVTTPILRFVTERSTNWRLWHDISRIRARALQKAIKPGCEDGEITTLTAFDGLVQDPLVSSMLGDKAFVRLSTLIQQAATHNPSQALSLLVYFLLQNPEHEAALRRALEPLFTKTSKNTTSNDRLLPSLHELENVPYLVACVREGLRIGSGNMKRIPRVFPDDEVVFHEWTIPRGIAVSMTPYWIHMDPDVFPIPHVFNPCRWLESSPEELALMNRYFIPFSKGSRVCLGKDVSYMQIYYTLALLFSPGFPQLNMYDTAEDDVKPALGLFFSIPRLDAKGLRVLLGR